MSVLAEHPVGGLSAQTVSRHHHAWSVGVQRWLLSRRVLGLVFLLLLTTGVAFRAASVWRPIDYTTHSPWREADLGQIARNFWRGEMNILYPQIDWRRDTPGYVECELPLLAWLMAAGYRVMGYHEEIGRVLALAISLATLLAFAGLARRILPAFQARMALIFFLFSPILLEMATNIQPDPMMLLFVVLSMDRFLVWLEGEHWLDALACGLAGALAILSKLPALYLGPLLAALCLERFGLAVLKKPAVWMMGLLMLVPSLAWYAHSHQFWLKYGNSLGLSDETHWLGLDLLARPGVLTDLLLTMIKTEWLMVLGGAGVVLAAAGWARAWHDGRVIIYWVASAFLFYLVALRTTGNHWAFYYHAISIPPLCLLMGAGCRPLRLLRLRTNAPWTSWALWQRRVVQVACALTLLVLGFKSAKEADLFPPRLAEPSLYARYMAARVFAPQLAAGVTVGMVGGFGFDETGVPVAYADSPMLFWLDRKGTIINREAAQLPTVEALGRQGTDYFVCERRTPLAEAMARRPFRLVSEFGDYQLYALK